MLSSVIRDKKQKVSKGSIRHVATTPETRLHHIFKNPQSNGRVQLRHDTSTTSATSLCQPSCILLEICNRGGKPVDGCIAPITSHIVEQSTRSDIIIALFCSTDTGALGLFKTPTRSVNND